jgi:hypothetical protein
MNMEFHVIKNVPNVGEIFLFLISDIETPV